MRTLRNLTGILFATAVLAGCSSMGMGMGGSNPCNPCAAKNACNPCAMKNACNPCYKNPCKKW